MPLAATRTGSSPAESAGSHVARKDANVCKAAVDQVLFEFVGRCGRCLGKPGDGNRDATARPQCAPHLLESNHRVRPQVERVHCHSVIEGGVAEGKPVNDPEAKLNSPCLDRRPVPATCHLEHRLRRIDTHNPPLMSPCSGKFQADPRSGAYLITYSLIVILV